jgi:uncharacterized short protein YbdD (DUF466 family)
MLLQLVSQFFILMRVGVEEFNRFVGHERLNTPNSYLPYSTPPPREESRQCAGAREAGDME